MYDTDGSGGIDFTEFMIMFHIMSDGTPDEVILNCNIKSINHDIEMTQVLGKIFRVFDVNGDGTISKEEMNTLMKDMFGLIKVQKPKCKSPESLTETLFLEMDKNNVIILNFGPLIFI